ncbi:helix-turn-helix transcriptional regulator [Niastella yeongjuensis]|uniref:Helix-turn-helix transcriptional regulator n=1 Tax=Niastella yeongjuensis TaxID=354355 RepID=A0A1V9E9Z5_9BACT|nr:LuxR C-terminal-related transcriptional regulator [Niastella yeongjuensis]OQP42911.1 helix-turn-helix transcriptional regulator [Niastella yeongjuensis]SEO59151.1 PAS fold-containing protein [Niastella yeongjuensis]
MSDNPGAGDYSKSHITGVPADLSGPEAQRFKQTIPKFPEEAVYIYSFQQGRMIYAEGWEDVLGYKDEEINMFTIINSTTPEYAPFSNELNDRALMFLHRIKEDLEKYSFAIEVKKRHKEGHEVPLISRVGVFRAEAGRVVEIIGRSQISHSITFGKVMRCYVYGPEKSAFEDELKGTAFHYVGISKKEKEALALVAKGYSFKQIAHHYGVSQSAIEKRIIPLYKKFDVKSLPHLVSFAYQNHILP